jgi:queuine tRNA-ribosyltransferase
MPGVTPPAHNTNSSVAISTSVGFRQLELQHYNVAIKRLKADISASLADVVTAEHAGAKRIARSADRTHAWLRDSLEEVTRGKQAAPLPFFASIPPLEPSSLLALYLSDLHYEYKPHTSGLCLYSAATAEAIPKALRELPSICLVDPPTPQALLATIHAGLDLVTVPFVTQASEAGIALSFSFPHSTADSTTRATKPLGFDLWSTTHASDLSPLGADCQCYTCRRHHRAYVHHLLQANEMLAWTLLQIHNYTVIDAFFHGVRRSLEQGTFEYDMETFGRAYESEMPAKTGQGPRVRGYQTKSGRGEPKKNAKAYGRLDDQMQKLAEAESGVATPDGDADDIEAHGLASKVDDINITR